MGYWDPTMNGGGILVMTATILVIVAAIVATMIVVSHSFQAQRTPAPIPATVEEILAGRYARGDIDEDEYHRRLTVLHTSRDGR